MQSKHASKDPNYQAEYQRQYQKRNKEQLRAYQKAYRDRKRLEREELALIQANEPEETKEKKPRKEHVLFITRFELDRPLGIEVLLTPFFKELKKHKQEMQIPYSHVLCCSITELKEHIESQFKDDMNWKNIDIAKIEGDSFQYTNLRPIIKN